MTNCIIKPRDNNPAEIIKNQPEKTEISHLVQALFQERNIPDLQHYTLCEKDQNFPMYDFYVYPVNLVLVIHKYSNLGPQEIYFRDEKNPMRVYSCSRERDFETSDGDWRYTKLISKERLRLTDTIVRDAFSPEMNFEKLIIHYKLVACCSVRVHTTEVDELLEGMGIPYVGL